MDKGLYGVGLPHSTLRPGKPATWEETLRNMYLAKKTLSRQAGLVETMQTSLREIKQKASKEETYRFGNLYRLISKESLEIA